MAVAKANSLEGGTNGTTISPANSGGASGDAFSSVTGTPKFYTGSPADPGAAAWMPLAAPHGGSVGASFLQGGTAANQALTWTVASLPHLYVRFYIYIPSGYPTGQVHYLCGSGSCFLALSSQTPALFTGGLSSIGGTQGPRRIRNNSWARLEVHFNAPLLTAEWRLYDSSSEGDNATNQYNGGASVSGMASSTALSIGWLGTVNAIYAGAGFYVDDIAISDTDWVGPSGAASRAVTGNVSVLADGLCDDVSQRASHRGWIGASAGVQGV